MYNQVSFLAFESIFTGVNKPQVTSTEPPRPPKKFVSVSSPYSL